MLTREERRTYHDQWVKDHPERRARHVAKARLKAWLLYQQQHPEEAETIFAEIAATMKGERCE